MLENKINEQITQGEALEKLATPELYQEVNAHSPEKSGYLFEVCFSDPDFNHPSISHFLNTFNSLPTLVIKNSTHKSEGHLVSVSPAHGRATEIDTAGGIQLESPTSEYGAFSLKGNKLPNDLTFAKVQFDAATGIRIDGAVMGNLRIIETYPEKCRKIAAAGIPSERIVAILRATHVPLAEVGHPETWDKPRLFDKNLRAKALEQASSDIDQLIRIDMEQAHTWGGDSSMNSRRVENILMKGEIIILLRAMQVNERIKDLHAVNRNTLDLFCSSAFSFVTSQDPEEYKFLPLSKDATSIDLLKKWLPQQMGFHLATWHLKGFVHGYAHAQNWTLAGTLIDNDSAREKAQFNLASEYERSVYEGYKLYDLFRTFEAIAELLRNTFNLSPARGNETAFKAAAFESFLIEYIKVAYPGYPSFEEKMTAFINFIGQELPNPHFDAMRDDGKFETISINKLSRAEISLWAQILQKVVDDHAPWLKNAKGAGE